MSIFGLTKKKTVRGLMAIVLSALIALSIGLFNPGDFSVSANASAMGATDFETEYTSQQEVFDAGNDFNEKMLEEGIVLLKNESNVLPLAGGARISVFGKNSARIAAGGTGSSTGGGSVEAARRASLYTSLRQAGFVLNQTLIDFYQDNSMTSGGSGPGRGSPSMTTHYGISTGETPMSMYTSEVKASYASDYKDAAVVVLTRIGGEGYDVPRTMRGGTAGVVNGIQSNGQPYLLATTDGENAVWGAKSPSDHYLELDKHESDLLKEVCGKFTNVVVVINASQPMELGFLDDAGHEDYHAQIKGALWIGGPGQTGVMAVGRVLAGTVNPSGRLVDTYYRDFKKDPAMQNFGANVYMVPGNIGTGDTAVAGYIESGNFLDYEEGIYLGYRYYETRGFTEGNGAYSSTANMFNKSSTASWGNWYDANIVFPFGYGLSYSQFSWSFASGGTADNAVITNVNDELVFNLDVTNNGSRAGKDVIQLYYSAPYYTNGIEKSHVTLGEFVKTPIIQPGQTARVQVRLRARDMASYDYKDANGNGFTGYELEAGSYKLLFSQSANSWRTGGKFDKGNLLTRTVTVGNGGTTGDFTGAAAAGKGANGLVVKTDDKTGTQIVNRFNDLSAKTGRDNSGAVKKGTMKEMSRANFAGTFPSTPVSLVTAATAAGKLTTVGTSRGIATGDLAAVLAQYPDLASKQLSAAAATVFLSGTPGNVDQLNAWDQGKWNGTVTGTSDTWTQNVAWHNYAAGETRPWSKTVMPTYATTAPANPSLTLKNMIGKAYGDASWDTFLNQLTLDQMALLISDGGFHTQNIDNLGVPYALEFDGPVGLVPRSTNGPIGGTYVDNYFPDAVIYATECVVAATWNQELVYEYGKMTGEEGIWGNEDGYSYAGIYGPGTNIHRTPFSGRNFEYYSECGVLSGLMARAYCAGMTEKGIITYLKHYFLNDQETNRSSAQTWVNEQAVREIYLKASELAFKGQWEKNPDGSIKKNGNDIVWKGNGSMGFMSGYNSVGSIWNGSSYALIEEVTRNEFGFRGMAITDWTSTSFGNCNNMIRLGMDKILNGGNPSMYTNTTAAATTATHVSAMRRASKNILYAIANSNAMIPRLKFGGIGYQESITLTGYAPNAAYTANLGNAHFNYKDAGNASTIRYGLKSGSLPAGLSLNTKTGVLSGTISSSAATSYTFTIEATSSEALTGAKQTYTVGRQGAAVPSTKYLVTGTVGEEYTDDSLRLTPINDYTGALYYRINNTYPLPAGLSINQTTGVISGTPAAETSAADNADGGKRVQIIVESAPTGGNTLLTVEARIIINPIVAKLSYSGGEKLSGTVGTAFSGSVEGAVGAPALTEGITYALKSGSEALPAGLTLNADGSISGTPTAAGAAMITVVASAAGYERAEAFFTINIGAMSKLTFSNEALTAGTAGTAYSKSVAATGATGITYALKSGSTLPAGLTLNTDGTISGTPSAAGVTMVTIVASAAGYESAEAAFVIEIKEGGCNSSILTDMSYIPLIIFLSVSAAFIAVISRQRSLKKD